MIVTIVLAILAHMEVVSIPVPVMWATGIVEVVETASTAHTHESTQHITIIN